MKKVVTLSLSVFFSLLIFESFSFAADFQKDIEKAAKIVEEFQQIPEQSIPREVLTHCKGLAVITVAKAGFIFSARGGLGVVIVKTANGWSAPSAIGMGGAGFGLQIGVQLNDFVIVLNTDDAVDAFSKGGNVTIGAGLSACAGPVGRTAEGAVTPVAAVYSYSRSKGLFAGVSLEGTVILERKEANEKYYGHPVRASELLSGQIPPPESAGILIQTLEKNRSN